MTLVFMQETIDYMFKVDPNMLDEFQVLGAPELVEWEEEGILTKYYKYQIE